MRLFRFLVVWWSCFCMLTLPHFAYAQAVPSVSYTPTGGVLRPVATISEVAPSFGRTWAANSSVPGSVLVGDKVRVAIGSANADMFARRAIPWAGVVRAGAKALPVVGTVGLIWGIFDSVRCYAGTAGTLGGMLKCDPGQAPQNIAGYRCQNPNNMAYFYGLTPSAACTAAALGMGQTYDNNGYHYVITYTLTSCGASSCKLAKTQVVTCITSCAYPGTTTVEIVVGFGAITYTACPAYSDGSGVTYPAGSAIGADGKCRTGGMVETTPDYAAAKAEPYANKGNAVQVAQDAVAQGVDLAPYAVPYAATGPASLTGQPVTTTTTPTSGSPSTVTQTPVYNITYGDNVYNYTTTNTTANPDGSTVTKTGEVEIKTCGLPGSPACKIDETGTEAFKADPAAKAGIDTLKTQDSQNRDTQAARVQDPGFGWFSAPPLAECEPFTLPDSMGSINPCGGVGTVRSVMGYVWALAGFIICAGMIRRTASGG